MHKNKDGNILHCAEPTRCGAVCPGRQLCLAEAVIAWSACSHGLEHTSLSLSCVLCRGSVKVPSSRAPSPPPGKKQLSVLQAQLHPAAPTHPPTQAPFTLLSFSQLGTGAGCFQALYLALVSQGWVCQSEASRNRTSRQRD